MPARYSQIEPPDRLQLINSEIVTEVCQAANAYHIMDSMTFLYLVNDIKYFASIYLITREEINVLKKELMILLMIWRLWLPEVSGRKARISTFFVQQC